MSAVHCKAISVCAFIMVTVGWKQVCVCKGCKSDHLTGTHGLCKRFNNTYYCDTLEHSSKVWPASLHKKDCACVNYGVDW